mmetsp:Transcript_40078/g.51669  ORF Transcript_40078/g.51669 Transcript_40078/m.51669 type:complete len:225 (+) Transcript_40078:125-799(+)
MYALFYIVVAALAILTCNGFQIVPVTISHTSFQNRNSEGVSLPKFTSPKSSFAAPSISKQNTVMMAADDDEMPFEDRIFSLLPYMLPILDGVEFGTFIYQRFPAYKMAVIGVLGTPMAIFRAIPFSTLIFFFGLSFLSRNPNISRTVRFNMQQAILLDIALIIPGLFGGLGKSLPIEIVEPFTNTIYYAYVASILYVILSNLGGKVPDRIPVISQAAGQQIGPF